MESHSGRGYELRDIAQTKWAVFEHDRRLLAKRIWDYKLIPFDLMIIPRECKMKDQYTETVLTAVTHSN